jgi:hypothetical protein
VNKDGEKKRSRLRRLLLECRDISKLITRSVDEPLSFFERLRVYWHLLTCRFCRRFEKQIFWLHDIFRSSSDPDLPISSDKRCLSEGARERIKETLKRNTEK